MTIGKRIKRLRLEHDLSQSDIGKIAGVTDKAVSTWEKDEKAPRMGAIEKIAAYFDVTKSYIIDGSKEPLPSDAIPYRPTGRMPVLGRVNAGQPMYAEENIEEYIANDYMDGYEYFALRVKGDSMNAAGITEGDYVIVRKQDIVDNGEIAIVLVNGDDATVKRFSKNGDTVVLTPQSHNPTHQVQIYNAKEIPIRVIGKVVEMRHRF